MSKWVRAEVEDELRITLRLRREAEPQLHAFFAQFTERGQAVRILRQLVERALASGELQAIAQSSARGAIMGKTSASDAERAQPPTLNTVVGPGEIGAPAAPPVSPEALRTMQKISRFGA